MGLGALLALKSTAEYKKENKRWSMPLSKTLIFIGQKRLHLQ